MENIPILHLDQFLLSGGNGVYINDLKTHLLDHHNKISHPHKHNFYLNVLFTHGEGIHEIDFNEFEVKPGSFFVMAPGQVHHWELSDDVKGFVFLHSKEFFMLRDGEFELDEFPFFYSKQNTPEIVLDGEAFSSVHDLCHNLLQEYKASHEYKALKIHSLITLVYIALTRAYSPTNHKVKRNSHYDSTIRTLEHLVEISYKDEKGPSYYADQLNITLKHLNRICNHVLGTSVSQVITARVLLEAKRLLMFRDLSIAEVANQLGYSDYSYFSRLFKKHTTQTPQQFRKGYIQ